MEQLRTMMSKVSAFSTVVMLLWPAGAYANPALPTPPAQAPVLITELQAGSADSASEEFIELYNTTAQPIEFAAHTWQLEVASSSATSWATPLRTIPLTGTIAAGGYYVVASQYSAAGQQVQYLPGAAQQWFSAGLSAAGGHVRLSYANMQQSNGSCASTRVVVDELEWGATKNGSLATPSLDARSPFVAPAASGLAAGNSLQRMFDARFTVYADTDADSADFMANNSPTPGTLNPVAVADPSDSVQAAVQMPLDGCTPVIPGSSGNTGNDGDTTSPVQPPETSPPSDDSGSGASDGETGDEPTVPTPPAAPSPTASAIPVADVGLLGPQLSELLPNPAAPLTDANDEFIELYNPNAVTFDLSGFQLVAGLVTTHSYTFPAGAMLAPGTFRAFFATDTGLSLSNSGGQVRLLDPSGALVMASDPYGTAKDGQAWVLAKGTWQWTITPTPSAANVLVPTAPVAKTATTKAPAKKAIPAVKATTTKAKPKAKKAAKAKKPAKLAVSTTAATSPSSTSSPLHPAILAGIGVIAVLYGAYEYRQDLTNYYQRLRSHRAHRRSNRPAPKGRRGRGAD